MAVNESRSLNGDLREGITDGTVKKIAPDRGGSQMDTASAMAVREDLASDLYGYPPYANGSAARRHTSLKG